MINIYSVSHSQFTWVHRTNSTSSFRDGHKTYGILTPLASDKIRERKSEPGQSNENNSGLSVEASEKRSSLSKGLLISSHI